MIGTDDPTGVNTFGVEPLTGLGFFHGMGEFIPKIRSIVEISGHRQLMRRSIISSSDVNILSSDQVQSECIPIPRVVKK